MASKTCLVLAVVVLSTILVANAGDPDLIEDFVAPDGMKLDANFFTFNKLRKTLRNAPKDASLIVTKVSQSELPALNGQSVSNALLQFGPGAFTPPHTHPRSSELLLLLTGRLNVGFVDSNNTLFTQVLVAGDVFVFPKGLVHFQANNEAKHPAVALSAFGSANPGTVFLPTALFGSGINVEVLAKSFKTDAQTIDKLGSVFTQA